EEADQMGLGIFPMAVQKFQTQLKVPHMGWNQINQRNKTMSRADEEHVYFVHSYYAEYHEDYTTMTCDYDGEFSAMIQRDHFLACQFHPEKSGKVGEEIIQSFLNGSFKL
ncbi:MAG: imidazole glycerol phosphate synthase subunit HisH, partial [Bacteroidota bacterium]